MAKPEYLRFRKGDVLAIVVVAVLAVIVAVSFLPSADAENVQAQIYQNGELIGTLSLDEEQTLELTGKYTNIITVQDGTISISSSDCPGEDCVHSGAIRSSGRSVVCLPNEVEVRVVNAVSDVDFVVG